MLKYKVNNGSYITLPEPKALTTEYNKIWSSNTGRLDSGYFVGDLVAIKRKLDISWGPMNRTDAQKVLTAVNSKFVTIQYNNETSATPVQGEFYWGDVSCEFYNLTVDALLSGCSCNAIER